METKYDVVVIGAGNGGLTSAVTCAKRGLKTLLIEQHNVPGGFASSFVRGRFEFEVALHELGNWGDQNEPGDVQMIFNELGINIKMNELDEAFSVYLKDENGVEKNYKLPFGAEEFAKKCDEYEPGSYQKVLNFIDICKNCYDAARYLRESRGNPDPAVLKSKYPNYLTVANSSLDDIMKKMKMPRLAKYFIETYLLYLGVRSDVVAASLYCIMFYEYIKYKAFIPENRSHEISQKIVDRFLELGGDVWYNTKALKIDVKDNQVQGIQTSKGYIKTNHIISNVSPRAIYGEMIDNSNIPSLDKKVVNYRTLGAQGFCIYIGLDVPAEKLGLHDYTYFMADPRGFNKMWETMRSLEENNSYIVVVQNNGCKKASPDGTSIISFTTLFNDAWNDVSEEEYFKTKERIAKRLIEDFENRMNVKISDHIEEIEIATPMTFARYTGSKNGVMYGDVCRVNDSPYVRGRHMDTLFSIKGLRFAGANSYFAHGYSITYVSGNVAGNKTFADYKMNEGGK